MFANFAAKRHFNGPLRAVSPVAENNADIDWKLASKVAKKHTESVDSYSVNSQKLIKYIDQSFQGKAKQDSITFSESCELCLVEAISLFVPLFYILTVLLLVGVATLLLSEPMFAYFQAEDYLAATYWACPTVLCVGFLYVLLRPVFGGFRSYHGRVLLKQEGPALFHLVEKMSRHLNVTPPKRIEVNNETAIRVDAYSGINSIYRDEYKLIIGAPLIMSLTLNELAAMIAHELSHFRCKQKKVAFYLMHHVSEWLYVRASGQDQRYIKLLKRMQKEKLPKYEYCELWVWQRVFLFQQKIFMGMFQCHRKLTAWKCREIEFETDAMARLVSGDKAFKDMFMGVRTAQFAQKAVSEQNDWAWKDGYLLDDYAKAVSLEAGKVSNQALKDIAQGFKVKISYFCPNDFERMEQVSHVQKEGILKANVAARFLLEDASRISKDLTLLDYEANGINDALKYCVSSEKIRKLKQLRDGNLSLAKQYFDGRDENRILKFEPSHEREILQLGVKDCIDYIRQHRVDDRKHQAAASNLFKRIEKTYILERFRHSKLPVHRFMPDELPSKKEAKGYLEYLQAQYQLTIKKMESMDHVFYQRAHEGMNVLSSEARDKLNHAFLNLELYCQVRNTRDKLILSVKPLNIIVNGLRVGVNTRTLQAGVAEKRLAWSALNELRKALEERPVMVNLHGKSVHILTYLDFKLGGLPKGSESLSVMAMAEYLHQLLQLLQFQYNKWKGQLANTLMDFERKNGISQVNLLHR